MEKLERTVVPIADNEDFSAHLEFINGEPFWHTEIHNWSRKSMNNFQILFDMVVEKCEEEGIETLSFYGTKASVKLAECFAPLDYLTEFNDEEHGKQFVGGWYV